jgi:hypothetical protein
MPSHTTIYFFLILLVVTLSTPSIAHKSASESAEIKGTQKFTLGFIPANPYAQKEQQFFVRAEDSNTGTPTPGLDIAIDITQRHYHDDEPMDIHLTTYQAREQTAGYYVVAHTFTTQGHYVITADITGHTILTKEFHVETKGPSPLFWTYMLLALVVAAIISTKSDTW